MELIPYNEGHRIFRESFRKFLHKEIVPNIEEWEEAGIVPREAWTKMGRAGFLAPEFPSSTAEPALISSIGHSHRRADPLQFLGLCASLHSDVVVPYIVDYATEEQKRKYLPGCISGDIITAIAMTEPNTGSDLAAIRTTAVEPGDEIVINGQKTFISNGINCDLLVLAARDPAEPDPHLAVDLFLVEAGTPGFEKGSGSRRLAGTPRTRRSSTSPTAGSRRRTAWAKRGRVS